MSRAKTDTTTSGDGGSNKLRSIDLLRALDHLLSVPTMPEDLRQPEILAEVRKRLERAERELRLKEERRKALDAAKKLVERRAIEQAEEALATARKLAEKQAFEPPELKDLSPNQLRHEDQPIPNVPSAKSITLDNTDGADGALSEIMNWTKGAQSIYLVDPYIFHFRPSAVFPTEAMYINTVCRIIPSTAQVIKIFGTGFTSVIRTQIARRIKEGRSLKFIDTTRIHDRMILCNENRALIIGTSFGGFGNKIFSMTEMSPEDIRSFRRILYEIEQNP